MRDRHATGAALAAIPLALGVAWDQGVSCLTWVFFGMAGVILVLTFADRLPYLERLPVFGSHPPPTVTFKLMTGEGTNHDMAYTFPNPLPPAVEIAFRNDHRDEITRVLLNLIVPDNFDLERCKQTGKAFPNGGERMWTDQDELGTGTGCWYWTWKMTLVPDTTVAYFRLDSTESGRYPIKLTLRSPDLYAKKDHVHRATLTITREDQP